MVILNGVAMNKIKTIVINSPKELEKHLGEQLYAKRLEDEFSIVENKEYAVKALVEHITGVQQFLNVMVKGLDLRVVTHSTIYGDFFFNYKDLYDMIKRTEVGAVVTTVDGQTINYTYQQMLDKLNERK